MRVTNWQKGDILINDRYPGVERVIVKSGKTYQWKYADCEQIFYSSNSADPHLELGWKKRVHESNIRIYVFYN